MHILAACDIPLVRERDLKRLGVVIDQLAAHHVAIGVKQKGFEVIRIRLGVGGKRDKLEPADREVVVCTLGSSDVEQPVASAITTDDKVCPWSVVVIAVDAAEPHLPESDIAWIRGQVAGRFVLRVISGENAVLLGSGAEVEHERSVDRHARVGLGFRERQFVAGRNHQVAR